MNASKTLVRNILKNKHFKNFKNFILGGIITIILGYIGNYLINKNLSKEDLGLFSYYYNLLTLLTTIFSLNIYVSYLRFNTGAYNEVQLKKNVKFISIIATVALIITTYIISKNILISVFSFLIIFNERTYFFRSKKEISKMNGIKYMSSIILIIGLLSYTKSNNFTFDKALLSYGIGYIVSVILGFILERKNKKNDIINRNVESTSIKRLLKYSIPISLTSIIIWISHVSDQIVMKEFLPLTELGNYAISYRIIVVIQIFTSLFLLYYPMLYFEEADKRNYSLIKRIRNIFIIILFLFTLILIFSRKFVYIILGASQYLDYTYIFIYLIIAEFIRIVSGLFLSFRSYTLQNWYSLIAIAIPSIIQICMNIIFIPKFGVYFAAIMQLISAILYLFITIFLAVIPEKRYFDQHHIICNTR